MSRVAGDPLADLASPEAWGAAPGTEIRTLETHISRLWFVGARVYKLKKPVDYGFLDFTSLERRRHYCEEEVRLNAELAPGVYLGVRPVTREARGGLRLGGDGEIVEWAVEMRRLPADRMLDALLARGEVDNSMWREVVTTLAAFHSRAATGPGVDEHGSPAAVAANVRENFEQIRPFVGTPAADGVFALSSVMHGFLAASAERFLREQADLLERRVRDGRIREGHGDLHAQNVCFDREGLRIYDRIEFDARYRCGDVACDLAFLAMDLDHAGFPGFSGWLADRYRRESGDEEIERLAPFYKAYRAVVRGKIACLRAAELSGDARERARLEAARYLQLAASYDLPPAAILTCGLPATGKTSLGHALARALRAPLLRSDVRRKVLAGLAPGERAGDALDAGLYSPEMGRRTYRSLLEQCVHELQSRRSVVIDATFAHRAQRAPFVDAMVRLGHPVLVVWLRASDELVRRRMDARALEPDEASDADWQVYLHAKQSFEPPTELPPGTLCTLDAADQSPTDLAGIVLDRRIQGAGAG